MNAPLKSMASIRSTLDSARRHDGRFLRGAERSIAVNALLDGTSLGGRARELAGRSVMIATRDPFALGSRIAAVSVANVWTTIFGVPLVPEVNSTHSVSQQAGG